MTKIPEKYIALILLIVWGACIVGLGLLRTDSYGIDEGAARALLLNWTVSSQIANPAAFLGYPDLRVLLFVPLGIYWTGSMLAAKILTIIIAFIGIWICFSWTRSKENEEVAIIGGGLFLLAPFALLQIDQIGVGPYLLALFGLGYLLDNKYRTVERAISAPFFVQPLLIAIATTLHPIGLALPLALTWRWLSAPIDKENNRPRNVLLSYGLTVFIILVMQLGWVQIEWLSNPLDALGFSLTGEDPSIALESNLFLSLIPATILLFVLIKDFTTLSKDTFGSALLIATLIGLFCADKSWAYIAYTLIIFRGTHWLIQLNSLFPIQGGVWQRGLVLFVIFLVATLFLQADKKHWVLIDSEILTPVDEVLQALATYIDQIDKDTDVRIASQWPGKTMLIVKRDTFPLPPAVENGQRLLEITKNITHMVFDQNDPDNAFLAKNISEVSDRMRTLAIHRDGVIVQIIPQSDLTENINPENTPLTND